MGIEYSSSDDPRKAHQEAVGDLSALEVFHTQILVVLYTPPKASKGGIIFTDKTKEADKWQSKVGLVLKKGPKAFVNDDKTDFDGLNVEVGEWVYFRPGDGWPARINGVDCRILDNEFLVKGRVSSPDLLW